MTIHKARGEEVARTVDDGAAFDGRVVEVLGGGRALDAGDLSSNELESLAGEGFGGLGIDHRCV